MKQTIWYETYIKTTIDLTKEDKETLSKAQKILKKKGFDIVVVKVQK